MIDFREQANKHEWPPIIYIAFLAAALVLDRFVPLPSPAVLRVLGGVAAAVGVALGGAAILGFFRAHTSVMPTARAATLVVSGVYRLTRNPMYLAAVLFYGGFGLAWPLPWLALLSPVMALALDRLAIRREERHLAARFGDAYRDYCRRVRRWL